MTRWEIKVGKTCTVAQTYTDSDQTDPRRTRRTQRFGTQSVSIVLCSLRGTERTSDRDTHVAAEEQLGCLPTNMFDFGYSHDEGVG